MKKIKMLNIMMAAGLAMAMTACSDDEIIGSPDAQMQETTTYFSSGESLKADIYYKPYVGYVGDPMPFFDPVSKTFRILYLQDMRDGNSTVYHPIHTVETTDAASYTSYGESIPCGGEAEDDCAIGTGSTIYAGGKYYTYYTGHKGTSPKEVLLRAVSDDCIHWTKDRSFRMQAPAGYSQDDFRDPYVFYDEDAQLYRMVVSAIRNGKAVLAQFTSTDIAATEWTEAEPFFQNKWGRFYECPDIFKMGDWWYLVYSDQNEVTQVQYFYARTLSELMNMGDDPAYPWRDEGKLEGGKHIKDVYTAWSFYAGKTASDGTDRYLWGWCGSRQGSLSENTADWAGSLVAHKLKQNEDGTLGLVCPEGIKSAIATPVALAETGRTEGAQGSAEAGYELSAGQSVSFARLEYQNRIEFDVTVDNPGTAVFGLSLVDCTDRDYNYRVYIEDRWDMLKFDKVTTKDDGTEERQYSSELNFIHPADGKYHVTMVSDQSVCVVYINDQYAFTNRVYGIQRNPWSLFCSDGSVRITGVQVYK